MKSKFKVTTPPSTAMYAHLFEPDVFRKAGQADGPPTYSVNTVIENTPEWDAFLSQILEFENNVRSIEGMDRVTIPTAIRDGKDGMRYIKFHTYSNKYLKIRAADGSTYHNNPGNGSSIRVNGQPDFKIDEVRGTKFLVATIWLEQVQVIDYVEDTGNNPFDVVEGNTTENPNSEDPFQSTTTAPTPSAISDLK